ncbi:uncharacterized protein DDB_G0283357 [Aplysia californica]|uniref:Uncharacterized protein DDB_G0283357 n=1 Tax=Aplysia californica TaxID=6500 RepID=A0ABM1A5H2_APLCA|nr:uncharacterized protein DDB_G0283357 [Aplysia californica]
MAFSLCRLAFVLCVLLSLLSSSAEAIQGCGTKNAVCSMTGQVKGTVTFGEIQGTGCFNSGNIQVIIDLIGLPKATNVKGKNNRVFTLRLKTYGEILPACTGLGPDFGGLAVGDLGSLSPDSSGRLYNDTVFLPRTNLLKGRDSVLGRSVVIYDGPYSVYGNNPMLGCCVIGLGIPTASEANNAGGNAGIFSGSAFGTPQNQFNNDGGSSKFTLIPYGNNNPNFGFQSSSPGFGSGFYGNSNNNNNQDLGASRNNFNNNNNGFGRGSNNYRNNGGNSPRYGFSSNGGFGQSNQNFNNNNNFNSQNGQSNSNRPYGYTNSQFPSVFSNIGGSDFFNLDGKLAGAALVNGGPDAATGLAGGSIGGGDSLASSLGKGFDPPKGPSFQDIYNRPTGESPLQGGAFSDSVSPERKNSLSDMFFRDKNIKDTIGLTDDDKFIPRESEDEESNSSYQSDSNDPDSDYPNYDDYEPQDDPYNYERGEEPEDYSPPKSDNTLITEATGDGDDVIDINSDGASYPEKSGAKTSGGGPKPIYASNEDSRMNGS